MSTNSKLESYLTTLNEHLGPISVSDRSEIIIEIKSHVTDALEKNPNKTIEEVLKDFGSAENIAKKYLADRGIKNTPQKKSTFITFLKWAFVVNLVLLMLFGVSLFTLIKKVSPIVDISEDEVSILGGFVHVDDNGVKIGDSFIQDEEGKYSHKGNMNVQTNIKEVKITALNGRLKISENKENKFSWNCKMSDPRLNVSPQQTGNKIEVDLSELKKMKCDFEIPPKLVARAFLDNGKIDIQQPKGEFDVDLKNGSVEINPDEGMSYKYDIKVQRGSTDDFSSTNSNDAVPIKARVVNGRIKNSSN